MRPWPRIACRQSTQRIGGRRTIGAPLPAQTLRRRKVGPQIRALLLRQPLDHRLRQGLGFHRAFNGIALHPHPGLEAFDRERAVLEQAVVHVEARAPQRRDRGLDHDFVAEPGGDEKAGMGVDQRVPGEIIGLEVIVLAHAERALDERRGAGVEDGEIAGVVDDPGRIAIAPFDAHEAAVGEHALSSRSLQRGASRSAPSRRITSPLIYVFSMTWRASDANWSGRPSSLGNGTAAARLFCASSGNAINIGVSKMPGAMALTRMPNCANSRAAGSVSAAMPPLE